MTTKTTSLLRFLAQHTEQLGVAESCYVVGGAVRNHLLGRPIKDVDLVVDTTSASRDSAWLAQQLQRRIQAATNLTTNQYGVALLTVSGPWELDGHPMKGEVVEIANARRESYGKGGQGYKPISVEAAGMEEDVSRRDFTVNTLLWRLADLHEGPDGAPVLDLTGEGYLDLMARQLKTPCDPDRTFTDDPTRMLRAVKFAAQYGFTIESATRDAVVRNAQRLNDMPWDAVRKLVEQLWCSDSMAAALQLMTELGLNQVLQALSYSEPGFHVALSRTAARLSLADQFALLDAGWCALSKLPVAVLNVDQQAALRRVFEQDPAAADRLLAACQRCPVDQQAVFARHNLKGKDCAKVMPLVRGLLIDNPDLLNDLPALEAMLDSALRGV